MQTYLSMKIDFLCTLKTIIWASPLQTFLNMDADFEKLKQITQQILEFCVNESLEVQI